MNDTTHHESVYQEAKRIMYSSLQERPTVSVVVVTWNCKKYAFECLTSLANQRANFVTEIIVVDNASLDGTPELVADNFAYVHLIRSDCNLGFAAANNLGIGMTRGNYICLINPDVNVDRDCLQSMVDYMEKESSVGLLGPQMLAPNGKVGRSTMRFPTLWNALCRAVALDRIFKRSRYFGGFLMRDFTHDQVQDVDVLNGWFWMARRVAINEVGLLDDDLFMYGDDLDWCRRFHKVGWRVVFYASAKALHYGGATTANAPIPFYIALQKANLQYWQKHHGWFAWVGFFFITYLHHVIRIVGHSGAYLFRSSQRAVACFKLKRSVAALLWLTGVGPNRIAEIR